MPARRASDPLVLIPLRVPASLHVALKAEAAAANCTLSDALRSHLTLAAAKPLVKRAPSRRPPLLAQPTGADPALLRQLAAIGSNLNQIARVVNGQSLAAKPLQALDLLTLLRSIERQIGALLDAETCRSAR